MKHTIKQKWEQLQPLESLNSLYEKAEDIQNLQKEINETLTKDEIMWSQRSRAIWIKWGDRNTKFFHAIASQRLKKNFTMGLMDLDGKWQEDLRSIEGIILDYFASIFKSNYSSNFEASLNVVNPKETLDMNGTLIAKFREEAI